ncbi:hypothetical protein L7F22_020186 [Adiantum nelumboides]|nr:hypothetical protein [Adiantum nelumboides]
MGEHCVAALSQRQGLEPEALSHLLCLLDQDDEDEDLVFKKAAPLSPASLVAFHAKAFEFASILNQDSPGLSFNLTHPSQASSQGLPQNCNRGATLIQSFLVSRAPPVIPSPALFDLTNLDPGTITTVTPEHGGHHRCQTKEVHNTLIAFEAGSKCDSSKKKNGYSLSPPYLYEDVHDMVIECAHVIGRDDTTSAAELLEKVRQFASANGSGAERVAYYFAKALEARLSGGVGRQLYSGHLKQHGPSSNSHIFKAIFMYMSNCPLAKAIHYVLREAMLGMGKSAKTVRIVEHIVTGFPYRSLFKALAASPGRPPRVHLLAANLSLFAAVNDRKFLLETLEERGRQLSACAALYGVQFQFTTWTGSANALEFAGLISPYRNQDEKLIILHGYPLHFVYDDFLTPSTAGAGQLKTMRALNPDLYVHGFAVGSYNTPVFPRRAKEALFHFECLYDMLDTFVDRENASRHVFESEILGKSVLDVVAFEDTKLAQRVTMYKQAHALTRQAGFKQLVLSRVAIQQVRRMLKRWHKDYMVVEDLEHLLVGWKGRTLHALSIWTGAHAQKTGFLG